MNNVKKKNQRVTDYKVSIAISVADNIVFKNDRDIFKLFEFKTGPNSKGWYPIGNTNYAIWLPIVSTKNKNHTNYLNVAGNEINERNIMNRVKKNNNDFTKRIVFAKFNGYKFIGIFIPTKTGLHKKISNILMLQ